MNPKQVFCPAICACFLSACGGSSAPPEPWYDAAAPLPQIQINETASELNNLLADLQNRRVDFKSKLDLEAQGSATYNGTLLGGVRTNQNTTFLGETIIGIVQIEANFDDADLSGTVTDMVVVENGSSVLNVIEDDETGFYRPFDLDTEVTPLDGRLVLSGGLIRDRDTFGQLDIDVEGNIELPARLSGGSTPQNFPVNGDLLGFVSSDDILSVGGDLQVEDGTTAYSLKTYIVADQTSR